MIGRLRAGWRLLAHPKREEDWTCPTCKTVQGTGRGQCMNGCGSRGPLAPPRPPKPEGAAS